MRVRWAGLIGALAAGTAGAAGFTFGENGEKALSMGGAFAGEADDLTAIQHNPGGLQQLQGFHFLVDLSLLSVNTSFQRQDAMGDPENSLPVSNSGGVFPLPFVALGYGRQLAGHPFTVALGGYGPPADGHYQYPIPETLCTSATDPTPGCVDPSGKGVYTQDPRKYAPQRYGFISSNTLLAYPTLSFSYAPVDRVAVGVSLQYVYANFQFAQSVTSAPFSASTMRAEDAHWDDAIKTHFYGKPTFTGILGVMVRATDWVQVGASIRPPIVINSSGTMDITPGYYASGLGATVTGDHANFELTMPMEIRVGTHWTPWRKLGVNADFVYEGWHRLKQFVITPTDISTQLGAGSPAVPLGQLIIPKNWNDTYSARLGASYDFRYVSWRAGVLFETAAAPTEYTNIDFPNFTRVMLTAGVGIPVGPVELLGTFVYVPNTTVTVTNSSVVQTNTNQCAPGATMGCLTPDPVGDGVFTAGGWILGFGVRGHL